MFNRLGPKAQRTVKTPQSAQGDGEGSAVARLDGCVYNDDPKLSRVVFICGLHRSGTTLLERLMATRYDVSYLRANTPESEGQHMQTVFPIAAKYGGPGRFAFSDAMVADLETLSDHAACHRAIMESWSRFVVGTSGVLLEKSPPNLTKIAWLRAVFPGSRFVVLTRDPRAVAGATQKWSNTSLAELVLHWNIAHARASADLRDEDCITVRYEDLTQDPNAALSRIARFCALEEKPGAQDVEDRFSDIRNSNDKYLPAHSGVSYGPGIWSKFGYDL